MIRREKSSGGAPPQEGRDIMDDEQYAEEWRQVRIFSCDFSPPEGDQMMEEVVNNDILIGLLDRKSRWQSRSSFLGIC